MIPGLPTGMPLPNISSGPAVSGNGDSMFDASGKFGGLNYKTGVNPWLIAFVVGAAVLLIGNK